jgi:hypothetical protein
VRERQWDTYPKTRTWVTGELERIGSVHAITTTCATMVPYTTMI